MPPESQYVLVKQQRGPSLTLVINLIVLALLGLSAFLAWRWLDANLLHWGLDDGKTTVVNKADLVDRVRAFELATVKHSYAGAVEVDARKVLNAGPAEVGLPSWVAGQKVNVKGVVTITGGTDLSSVTEDDMHISREGDKVLVTIVVPEPQILSAEIVPSSFDIDTSQGVLTRLRTRIGLDERDLRDDAVGRLVVATKGGAVEGGLLEEARIETEARLEAFLNSLPQAGDERVVYDVQARAPTPH